MAKDKRIYEISLSSITQNGAACKNPTITWEKPECANVRCGVVDGKTLTIEIPEDCPDPCLYVVIDCTDDCALCEPERIKICPCDLDADCPDCESCVMGMCISTCNSNEFCLEDGICGECDETHPCPKNQICVTGNCECPPGMPYVDSKGNCSECDDTHPCPPCFVCTPNGCVPKDCLHCDAQTGDCVECFSNTDCTGANECCVGDTCACCEGFILDVTTGNCIPRPDCIRDTDCGTCQTCNDGGCVDVVCPPGFIRIPGNPCCVKECDCDDPSCPRAEQCIRLDQDNCYCAPCSGSCDENNDCGDGCYCDNGQCKPNPCAGACNDGFDCGEGCGCQDGNCVPCSSLDCSTNDCTNVNGCYCNGSDCEKKSCGGDCSAVSDCPPGCACYQGQCVECESLGCDACKFAAGCDCIDEEFCISSPCLGNCVDGNDCPGVDCGCDKGKQSCVSCQSYACANGELCPDGCICKDGKCEGNPCDAIDCDSDIDCGPNCECEGGKCKPCADGDPNCGNFTPCGDLLVVNKLDANCDLEATLTTKDCCGCEDISVGLKLNNPTADGSYHVKFDAELQLRGGSQSASWAQFLNKPLLSAFQDQVLPVSGKFDVIIVEEYGGPTGPFINTRTVTVDMTNDDNYTILQTPKIEFTQVAVPGQIYNIGGSLKTHIKTTIKLASNGALTLENGCISTLPASNVVVIPNDVNGLGILTSLNMSSKSFELVKSNNCKKPKLTWYRGDTPVIGAATIIDTAWMDLVGSAGSSNIFNTKLETPAEGLLYGKYYWALPSCTCWLSFVPYSCHGFGGVPTKLTFDPEIGIDFTLSDCCKKVTFDEVSLRCDVMTAASPAVKYVLYINGVATATEYTLLNTGVLIPNGTMYTHTEEVTSVGLKPKLAECATSLVTVPGTCDPFTSSFDFIVDTCYTAGDISIQIQTVNAATGTKVYEIDNGIDPVVTGTFLGSSVTVPNVPAQSATYEVKVTLADGCEHTTEQILDLDDYVASERLLVTTGCSGSGAFVRFENNFRELAEISMNANTYYASGNSFTIVPANSGVLFDYDFFVQSNPACRVSKVGELIVCCQDIDYNQIVIDPITCLSPSEIDVYMTNNEAFTTIISFYGANNQVLRPEVTLLPGTSQSVQVEVEYPNTTVRFAARPAAPNSCPETTISTYDTINCAEDVLGNFVIDFNCRSGNGGNGIGDLRVTDNNVPQVANKVFVNTSLVFDGVGSYTWVNIPQPNTYNVRVELPNGSFKDQTVNIDCRV